MQNTATHVVLDFVDINLGQGNKIPELCIELNEHMVYRGQVLPQISLTVDLQTHNLLRIFFVNKQPSDTQVDTQGHIISDMNFALGTITVEGIALDEALWQSRYVTDTDIYQSCLFFGPKGYYELAFDIPVLKWKLQLRYDRGELDSHWEEDYNYYTTACQILKKLSTD